MKMLMQLLGPSEVMLNFENNDKRVKYNQMCGSDAERRVNI